MRNGLSPKRVTNAMWDFSWICGHYPEGPFENFDKVTDELLERGFNTVRIDSLPWIIGNLKDPASGEKVTFPANPLSTWGLSTIEWKHDVFAELVEFLRMAKKKNLFVGLSNWWIGCKEISMINAPVPGVLSAPQVKVPVAAAQEALVRGWRRVLDMVRAENLGDAILYVDFDQEYPLCSHTREQLDFLADPDVKSKQPTGRRWNERQSMYVADYFSTMLKSFQREYPEFRFTFSLVDELQPEVGACTDVRALNMPFDILDLHFWIRDRRFKNRTGFDEMVKDRGDHDYTDYQSRVDRAFRAVRPMLLKEMENQIAFSADWGQNAAVPIIVTEAWGPYWHMDHRGLRWDWLKDWCADSMSLAANYGLWGVTPWNFSHPIFGNWTDVKWYRDVNTAFLNS
jgi:hypothetical protein